MHRPCKNSSLTLIVIHATEECKSIRDRTFARTLFLRQSCFLCAIHDMIRRVKKDAGKRFCMSSFSQGRKYARGQRHLEEPPAAALRLFCRRRGRRERAQGAPACRKARARRIRRRFLRPFLGGQVAHDQPPPRRDAAAVESHTDEREPRLCAARRGVCRSTFPRGKAAPLPRALRLRPREVVLPRRHSDREHRDLDGGGGAPCRRRAHGHAGHRLDRRRAPSGDGGGDPPRRPHLLRHGLQPCAVGGKLPLHEVADGSGKARRARHQPDRQAP